MVWADRTGVGGQLRRDGAAATASSGAVWLRDEGEGSAGRWQHGERGRRGGGGGARGGGAARRWRRTAADLAMGGGGGENGTQGSRGGLLKRAGEGDGVGKGRGRRGVRPDSGWRRRCSGLCPELGGGAARLGCGLARLAGPAQSGKEFFLKKHFQTNKMVKAK